MTVSEDSTEESLPWFAVWTRSRHEQVVREQLQQKMIRTVIAPDPKIIPKSSDDHTIPDLVARVHERLTHDNPFGAH